MVQGIKTGMTLSARLRASTFAAAALGLVSAPIAAADFMSHRSSELVFAKDDFSTWSPRKGKMSYEDDASQPDYGQGRGTSYTKTCAKMAQFVGPGGGAQHGDVITVKPANGGNTCTFSKGLIITKGVTLKPFVPKGKSNPKITRIFAQEHKAWWNGRRNAVATKWEEGDQNSDEPWYAGEAPKYLPGATAAYRGAYNLHFDCEATSGPCVTTNVPGDKTVTILNTHFRRITHLKAPMIETHRGGIVLVGNFIEGKYASPETPYPPAILVHSNRAVLKNNLIADAYQGVKLHPAENYSSSTFKLTGNIITNVTIGVQAEGTKELVLTENLFGPNAYGKLKALFHVMVSNGTAMVNQNVFRNSLASAVMNMPSSAVKINLDRNLFEDNATVAFDIGGSLVRKSPFPSGNICKKQPFQSFYNGRPHYTGYVTPYTSMMQPGMVDFVYTGPKKKTSRSKLRKSKRNQPALWDGYIAYLDTAAGKIKKEQSVYRQSEDPKARKRSTRKSSKGTAYPARKGELWGEMWGVYSTFSAKRAETVGAHVLFDQYNLSARDGFTSCFDYSSLYKFDVAPDRRGS
jgi:hypothetical protein